MWVSRKEIETLSRIIESGAAGKEADIRDNKEGAFSILKDDIYRMIESQKDQLDSVSKQRDILAEYMSDISHQLKTPITSMRIMADLMETADPEKQAEFLTDIRMMLGKMDWLVKTLLNMAKIDAGTVGFVKKTVTVSELMKEVLPSVGILLDINDQKTELLHDTPMECDPRWTVEALTNIVKNAAEHSPKGSTIEIDSGENAIYRFLSVRDHGEGIDPASLAKMFRRFEYSTNESGFGIGMPLAMSIMKGQGGDLCPEKPKEGDGTVFILKFFK
ncbi:MAG: HAMP domain-containing histidine kinase [Lachnospiraceae bacterium]|nr:HAMP domain-containing histidine kinase [Lachnospiraceae bacterium]